MGAVEGTCPHHTLQRRYLYARERDEWIRLLMEGALAARQRMERRDTPSERCRSVKVSEQRIEWHAFGRSRSR
jgi:hypothetical protein